jgi:hypothetical protein
MLPEPMLGDVAAGAKPHPIAPPDIVEKLDEANRPRRAADQPVVQVYRHHLRLVGALFIQEIEAINHVARKIVSGVKALVAVEAIVIGFVGTWNDEVAALADRNPERQLVAEVVPVVEEAAVLNEETPGIVARPSAKPANGHFARQLQYAGGSEANVLALGLLVDAEIVSQR